MCLVISHEFGDEGLFIIRVVLLPMQETLAQSLGQEDPLEKGMVTHSVDSCLQNPMDREAWRATVHGVTELDMTEVTKHSM